MGITQTDQYSGIIINQNATPTGSYSWDADTWIWQTVHWSSDYAMGTDLDEQRVPDLSGFQIFVSIPTGQATEASFSYQITTYTPATRTWVPIAQGSVTGAPTDGDRVWMDVILPESISITTEMLSNPWQIGIGDPVNITGVWYVSPSPVQGRTFQGNDGIPLLGSGTSACLNYRTLALVADNGVDFLGNEYRSCVIQASASATNTLGSEAPTNSPTFWISPPLPSRFAVKSLYFDVRPVQLTPQFGLLNVINNPGFEYDGVDQEPQWWTPYNNEEGGTILDQSVHSTLLPPADPNYTPWAKSGFQSLHMHYTFTSNAALEEFGIISPLVGLSATTGGEPTPLSMAVGYDLITATNAQLTVAVLFYDHTETLLPLPYYLVLTSTTTVGTGTLTIETIIPATAAYAQYVIFGQSDLNEPGSLEAYVDDVQVTYTPTVPSYFDGDSNDAQWTAQRGLSPSAQLIEPAIEDNHAVIDGALVDPLTPNMSCNIYYSNDDAYTTDNMTEADWEQKLWTRVPKTFTCTHRQEYMFPQPVYAKYMQVEFTNLQSQSYDPGPWAQPVSYKKFPTWVANYFIGQLTIPSLIASQVIVEYDALSFAYDYYLDDLIQAPTSPSAAPADALSQLTNYFTSATNEVDATTLSQINLNLQQFQLPAGSVVDPSTALGAMATTVLTATDVPPQAAEGGSLPAIDYSSVSSLKREPVLLEQNIPPMYFFITCRHSYKEVVAPFDYNRAYYAGVNAIAFIRDDYTVASDASLYIESGADSTNLEIFDFTIDPNGIWLAQDSSS